MYLRNHLRLLAILLGYLQILEMDVIMYFIQIFFHFMGINLQIFCIFKFCLDHTPPELSKGIETLLTRLEESRC